MAKNVAAKFPPDLELQFKVLDVFQTISVYLFHQQKLGKFGKLEGRECTEQAEVAEEQEDEAVPEEEGGRAEAALLPLLLQDVGCQEIQLVVGGNYKGQKPKPQKTTKIVGLFMVN